MSFKRSLSILSILDLSVLRLSLVILFNRV
jgi:hypothetical protein